MIDEGNHQGTKGDGRMLPRKLLDERQGKFLLDMEISDSSGDKKHPPEPTTRADFVREHAEHVLLHPPIIKAMGKIATVTTTNKLQIENKLPWTETLLRQPILLQWETHNRATILPRDHWDHWDKRQPPLRWHPRGWH